MKRYLDNHHSIRLQHDNFESQAREIIRAIVGPGRESTTVPLTKLVKAAFFSGRDQVIDEINGDDDHPDSIKLGLCGCGATTCTDVWFRNVGKFTQGSGFTMKEAIRLKIGWDLAAPGGDQTVIVHHEVKDGKIDIIDIEAVEGAI